MDIYACMPSEKGECFSNTCGVLSSIKGGSFYCVSPYHMHAITAMDVHGQGGQMQFGMVLKCMNTQIICNKLQFCQ